MSEFPDGFPIDLLEYITEKFLDILEKLIDFGRIPGETLERISGKNTKEFPKEIPKEVHEMFPEEHPAEFLEGMLDEFPEELLEKNPEGTYGRDHRANFEGISKRNI